MSEWVIDEETVEVIAIGTQLLGSGGGGDIAFDLPPVREAIRRYGPVKVVSCNSLHPESLIVPIGFMGAPLEPSTLTAGQKELERVLEAVEIHYGKKVDALIPLEIGGGNGLTPLAHAGRLNIPVLDADTIGRAFPMLHMTSCRMAGIAPNPAFIADSEGNVVCCRATSAEALERLARAITSASGSVTALATYIVRGFEAKKALLLGSYTHAYALGYAFLQGKMPGHAVAEGMIHSFTPKVEGGFLRGKMALDSGVSIAFQNEYFFVTEGNTILASTPDVIAIIDKENNAPLAIEGIKEGQHVRVFAIASHPLWKTKKGLEIAGKEAFMHLL